MKSFLTLITLAFLLVSCNTSVEDTGETSTKNEEISEDLNFIHTVFFWLKEDVTPTQRTDFEDGMIALGQIESIGKYYMGVPADTDRDVVDSGYDYAWIVHFQDGAAEEEYQVDSIHLDFIEKYRDLWEKVVVYDTDLKASE